MKNYAKKSLGQNFLKSKEALREIVAAGDLKEGETVLEVGPGRGALTESLLEAKVKVIAVEKDDSLMPLLKEKFSSQISTGQLTLIHADILDFDPKHYSLFANHYKLIANIPYYITGIFLRKFLGGETQPSKMVLMLQKEVAKRIVAADKKESILSISVKAYGAPKYIMTVQKKYFSPEPNVDSAVLLIDQISKDFFKEIEEEKFFALIKAGFSHKRKILLQNMNITKEEKEKIIKDLPLSPKARAEDIALTDWKKIYSLLH